jgi:hypothetical protein
MMDAEQLRRIPPSPSFSDGTRTVSVLTRMEPDVALAWVDVFLCARELKLVE